MNTVRAIVLSVAITAAGGAAAHRPSDSQLRVDLTTSPVSARWDIAVRDLELMLGVDANADSTITWGELRARHDFIASYVLARLTLSRSDKACHLQPGPQRLANHIDGVYSILDFTVHCGHNAAPDTIEYHLFFDQDRSHRGLVQIHGIATDITVVMSPDNRTSSIALNAGSSWQTFQSYWREGVTHIWAGPDHLVFLLSLLLPAVMLYRAGRWSGAKRLQPCVLDVVCVVTAFTAAHSLTLLLSVTGWLSPPAWLVEPIIAATVLLAALNNLMPVWHSRRWTLAFGLGLIHGFGFAGALQELGLPTHGLLTALAGFNLGVEAGQLLIVAAFLPVAWLLRHGWFYRRVALQTGSLAIAGVAVMWLIERSQQAPWFL